MNNSNSDDIRHFELLVKEVKLLEDVLYEKRRELQVICKHEKLKVRLIKNQFDDVLECDHTCIFCGKEYDFPDRKDDFENRLV